MWMSSHHYLNFLLNVDVFNVSSVSCLHHVDVFQLPVGSLSICECLPGTFWSYLIIVDVFKTTVFTDRAKFLTMWMSSHHYLKFPARCRCLQCLIWKLTTSCRCLPIASSKFLTMWMSYRHFLKLPTYCVCLQNVCLYRQGDVSHYVKVFPSQLEFPA